MFSVRFRAPGGADVALPYGFTARPLWYSKNIYGGSLQADIEIDGELIRLWSLLNWVGRKATIYNQNNKPVWWGYFNEVLVSRGGLQDGLSLEHMYNRIKIAYTYEDFGAPVSAMTAWGEHAASIEKLGFRKELIEYTEIEATPLMAEVRRDLLLDTVGLPVAIASEGGGIDEPPKAIMRCSGHILSLGWLHYEQSSGLEANEDGSGSQVLGQEYYAGSIGFTKNGKVSDLEGRLHRYQSGSTVRITGTSGGLNNGTFRIGGTDTREKVEYPTASIRFDPTDDIFDDDENLSFIEVDDYVQALGVSANNTKVWRITSANGRQCTTDPKNVSLENNPPSGILRRGNSFRLDGEFVKQAPGLSGTIRISTHGLQVAQSFRLAGGKSWELASIELQAARVGTPTDFVVIEIRQDNNGSPGALLLSASRPAIEFGVAMATETWTFAGSYMLQPNETYWIVVRRSGAYDPLNYYMLEVDEGVGYSRGVLKLWTGAAWVARSPDADLQFRVLGRWETTRQIREIVSQAGQYINGVDILTPSGVFSNQWRAGDQTAYNEFVGLMRAGTLAGRMLLAEVTVEQILRIYEAPTPDNDNAVQQMADGEYLDHMGRPLEPGFLPVGRWLIRPDIPSAVAAHFGLSPRLVEEAEYDCVENRIRSIRFVGAPDTMDILEL